MAYQGNTAYQLDYSQNTWEVPVGRGLSLHEGGGIDAQVRRQTSSMTGFVRLVVAATIALALLGVCRVALTVRTVYRPHPAHCHRKLRHGLRLRG